MGVGANANSIKNVTAEPNPIVNRNTFLMILPKPFLVFI